MSGKLALLIGHRVEDLAARTAEETIRRRLDGGEALESLDREEFWEFRYRTEELFEEKLTALIDRAELFVNPNKHRWRISTGGIAAGHEGKGYLLKVTNREDIDGDVAKHTLTMQYGFRGLEEVRYGVLWIIRLAEGVVGDGPAGDAGRALAEKIAVTKSRDSGLLVNPHYQEWSLERIG